MKEHRNPKLKRFSEFEELCAWVKEKEITKGVTAGISIFQDEGR